MSQNRNRSGHGTRQLIGNGRGVEIFLYQETAESKRKSGLPAKYLIVQIQDNGPILARKHVGNSKSVEEVIKMTAEFLIDWTSRLPAIAVDRCEEVLL